MKVLLNEKNVEIGGMSTLDDVRRSHKADADIMIVNGFPAGPDHLLHEGDSVTLIRRGEVVGKEELEALMSARHTPGVHAKLKGSFVGIAGAGGLGSHVAMALARIGVGRILIVDMDVVEPSNLNRQLYKIDQIGGPKVEALAGNLREANPYVRVDIRNEEITIENCVEIFRECDLVIEAFDTPKAKADLINTILSGLPEMRVVAGSGLAGYGPSNSIRTERLGRLYICGDRQSEAGEGSGLMAPRVMITAGHQANQAVRILLGEENVE